MWVIKKENKFVSYLIILISLFVLFIFTLEQYKQMQINLDNNLQLLSKSNEKYQQIQKNDKIREKIKNNEIETNKYLVTIKEDEIIKYIYWYIEDTNSSENKVEIKSIDISEPKKNDLGFLETDINLSVKVSNDITMKRLLYFFVSESSKYKFFIDNFTYPNDWRMWSYSLEIPLKVFYK